MQRLTQVFGWVDFPRPLFYEAEFALRFELGGELPMGPRRFLQAMDRARAVASALFAKADRLTVATSYLGRRLTPAIPAKLRQALGDTEVQIADAQSFRPPPRDSNDLENAAEGWHRFIWTFDIRNDDSQILPFLWASVANEMPIAPRFPVLAGSYIMDLTNGVILFVYDDRGMDAAAVEPELLRPSYEKFNSWLLDHDRPLMDAMFADPDTNSRDA